jgi:Family of unknown function (DUF6640)
MTFDHILVARILFTLTTLGWGALTVVADFNKTHATNLQWTPHARFHVVWQISSYVGFGLVALALIWWPGSYATERLYFVALMGAIVYGAFFVALTAMPLWWRRLRQEWLQAVQGAAAIVREKMGRQYHRLLDPACVARSRRAGGGGLAHFYRHFTPAAQSFTPRLCATRLSRRSFRNLWREVFRMISFLAGLIVTAAGVIGVWYAKPQQGQVQWFVEAPVLEWLIPTTLVAVFGLGLGLLATGAVEIAGITG